jgi:CDP-diacylglycerol--serine O-phosphatidyltransferase
MGKLGWIAAFIYAAGAALRLARFNTQIGIADKRFFQGLASPAAAAIVTGMVWVGFDNNIEGSDVRWFAFVLTVAAGLLMVSNFRYYSFKDINLRGKVPFVAILAIVLLFVIYSLDTPSMLFLTFLIYAISGPIVTVLTRRHPAPAHHVAPAKGKDEESEENEE